MNSGNTPRRPAAWRRYLRFWGADPVADVDDELQFHLEMRSAEYAARGLSSDAARQRAEQRFGRVDHARDACLKIDRQQARAESQARMLIGLRQDAVYGAGAAPAMGARAGRRPLHRRGRERHNRDVQRRRHTSPPPAPLSEW